MKKKKKKKAGDCNQKTAQNIKFQHVYSPRL